MRPLRESTGPAPDQTETRYRDGAIRPGVRQRNSAMALLLAKHELTLDAERAAARQSVNRWQKLLNKLRGE